MNVLLAFLANSATNFVIGLLVAKFLGPEEYGRFAIAFSISAVVQTALFDWLRLSATRFYSVRVRDQKPVVRGDARHVLRRGRLRRWRSPRSCSHIFGPTLDFDGDLILLALLTAVVNGLFDYSTALVRARFDDHLFGRLVFVKNVLVVAPDRRRRVFVSFGGRRLGGHDREPVRHGDRGARLADRSRARRRARRGAKRRRALIAYSAPIVAANLLYQAIPLAARSIVADVYDFAETGQFALAFDLGMRAMLAFGSALDVLLFQIAVAAHENHGAERARRQVGRNMAVVLAFLLPACTGLFLVMPSIELLIVPAQYRGPFAHYLGLLLPGLFAMGMILFGVNPVFQIGKKTAPMVGAALVAVAAGFLLVVALPWGRDASSLALAQCGAYLAALVATLFFAARAKPIWPRPRDVAFAVVATGGMVAVLSPLREMTPGILTLLLQVSLGVVVYGVLTLIFDTAGLRGQAMVWIKRRRARAVPPPPY